MLDLERGQERATACLELGALAGEVKNKQLQESEILEIPRLQDTPKPPRPEPRPGKRAGWS